MPSCLCPGGVPVSDAASPLRPQAFGPTLSKWVHSYFNHNFRIVDHTTNIAVHVYEINRRDPDAHTRNRCQLHIGCYTIVVHRPVFDNFESMMLLRLRSYWPLCVLF